MMKRLVFQFCSFCAFYTLFLGVSLNINGGNYECVTVSGSCQGIDTLCSEECASPCGGNARTWLNTVLKNLNTPGPCNSALDSFVSCSTDVTCGVQTFSGWSCVTLGAGQSRCDNNGANPNGSCGQCTNNGTLTVNRSLTWSCMNCLRGSGGGS